MNSRFGYSLTMGIFFFAIFISLSSSILAEPVGSIVNQSQPMIAPINNLMLNFTVASNGTYNFTGVSVSIPAGVTFITSSNKSAVGPNVANFTNFVTNVTWSNFTTTTDLFNNLGNQSGANTTWFAFNVTTASAGTFSFTIKTFYNSTSNTNLGTGGNTSTSSITATNGTITLTNATFSNFTYNGNTVVMNFTASLSASTGGGSTENVSFNLNLNSLLVAQNGTCGSSTSPCSSSVSTINFTVNGTAGLYAFVFNTSGDNNYTSTSLSTALNIAQATPVISTFVNNVPTINQTVTYPSIFTIVGNATLGNSTVVTVPSFTMYIQNTSTNATVISTSGLPATFNSILGNGTYQIIYNDTASTNYTSAANSSLLFIVNKGTFTIQNVSVQNNTANNTAITYPTSAVLAGNITSTGVAQDVTFQLWWVNASSPTNAVQLASGSGGTGPLNISLSTSVLLGNSTYYLWFNNTAGANWTANTTTSNFTFVVNKGAFTYNVSVLNSTANNTIAATYPATSFVGANVTTAGVANDVNFSVFWTNSSTGVATPLTSAFGSTATANVPFSTFSSATLGANSTSWYYYVIFNNTAGANWTAGSNSTVAFLVNQGALANYLDVSIDGSYADLTETYPASGNTVAGRFNSTGVSDITFALFNTTSKTDITSSQNNTLINRTAGTFTFVYGTNTASPANWTAANSTTRTLTINKGTPNVGVFVNNVTGNQTVTYPNALELRGNSTSTSNLPTFTLYVQNITSNNATVTSTTGNAAVFTPLLGNGTFQIFYNTTGNINWTAASTSSFLLVNKGIMTLNVFVANSTSNNTAPVQYPNSLELRGNTSQTNGLSDVLFQLWWINATNGAGAQLTSATGSSGTSLANLPVLGNGTYYAYYNISTGANWTANATGANLTFTVLKGSPIITIYVNSSTSGVYQIERGSPVNISVQSNATIDNISTSISVFTNFTGSNASISTLNTNGLNWLYNITGTGNASSGGLALANYTISANISTSANYTSVSNNTILLWVWDTVKPVITSFTQTRSGSYIQQSAISSSDFSCNTVDNSTVTISITGLTTQSPGSQTATCTATDQAGNVNTSTTTYTVLAPAAPATSSSSISSTSVQSTIHNIAAGGTQTVAVASGTPVTQLTVTVSQAVAGVVITVNKLSTPPANTPPTVGKVFSYLDFEQINLPDSAISSIKIDVNLDKSWISANNIDPAKIYLSRLVNGAWTRLPTVEISSDSSTITYEATSSGLSTYAIEGDILAATQPTSTPTQNATQNATQPTQQATYPSTPSNSAIILYEVLAVVVIIVVAFFAYRFRGSGKYRYGH